MVCFGAGLLLSLVEKSAKLQNKRVNEKVYVPPKEHRQQNNSSIITFFFC